MIAGHAALSFLVASLAAYYIGKNPDQCIKIGIFAGVFAVLPDLDIVFAAGEVLKVFTSGLGGFIESFWDVSGSFHRGVTHSVITLFFSTVFFVFYRDRKNKLRLAAITVFFSSVYGLFYAGAEAAVVLAVFMTSGMKLSSYSVRFLSRKEFMLSATSGLMIHPFGDIFTGTPPDFLFPLNFTLIESRVVLNQDPVLNLLSILLLELLLVFLAVLSAIFLREDGIRGHMSYSPLVGLLYAPLYFVLPEPTLSSPYIFVFVAVGLGLLANILAFHRDEWSGGHPANMHGLNFVLTFLAASISYGAVYLLV